eukprot:gene11825-biopygen19909
MEVSLCVQAVNNNRYMTEPSFHATGKTKQPMAFFATWIRTPFASGPCNRSTRPIRPMQPVHPAHPACICTHDTAVARINAWYLQAANCSPQIACNCNPQMARAVRKWHAFAVSKWYTSAMRKWHAFAACKWHPLQSANGTHLQSANCMHLQSVQRLPLYVPALPARLAQPGRPCRAGWPCRAGQPGRARGGGGGRSGPGGGPGRGPPARPGPSARSPPHLVFTVLQAPPAAHDGANNCGAAGTAKGWEDENGKEMRRRRHRRVFNTPHPTFNSTPTNSTPRPKSRSQNPFPKSQLSTAPHGCDDYCDKTIPDDMNRDENCAAHGNIEVSSCILTAPTTFFWLPRRIQHASRLTPAESPAACGVPERVLPPLQDQGHEGIHVPGAADRDIGVEVQEDGRGRVPDASHTIEFEETRLGRVPDASSAVSPRAPSVLWVLYRYRSHSWQFSLRSCAPRGIFTLAPLDRFVGKVQSTQQQNLHRDKRWEDVAPVPSRWQVRERKRATVCATAVVTGVVPPALARVEVTVMCLTKAGRLAKMAMI